MTPYSLLAGQGDTLVKYLLDELFTYEEDHRNALQPNDDGSTTDLKGLDERRELQAADPTRNNPHPDDDNISAIVTRAVNAALASHSWTPQAYYGQLEYLLLCHG